MPLQDLFGSLDNLAGGALSDALSKAAESTSLDETLGNALSESQDIAGNAEELSADAEEAWCVGTWNCFDLRDACDTQIPPRIWGDTCSTDRYFLL